MAWRHHDSDINDPVLKDGFMVTTSEYLRFPFLSGTSILKGPALSSHDRIPQHTTCPFSKGQNIPEKIDHQRRVEVEDPKIVATRERKARAMAKKRERKKQGGEGGEGSWPKTKRRKTIGRRDGHVASEATSSLEPLRTLNPHQPSGALAAAVKSRENRSPPASLRDSANRSVHNYSDDHRDEETDDLNLGSSDEQSGRALTLSHAKCGDLSGKLVQARLDLTHSSHLYTSLSDRHKALKNKHEGCAGKLKGLENRNRELSQGNRDQVLQIKELEAALAQNDFALFYAERINAKQAQEKERLRSLSEPFNLAIQAGWGKGLAEERSKEDLLELMGRMEGFDVHADTKMRVEYDKLFERRYPYVKKIYYGFFHSVSDLLKVYLDSPPRKQVSPHKPSSEKVPSTSAPLGS
nr:hypothetical protein [Tanacetum cinerariifolium]